MQQILKSFRRIWPYMRPFKLQIFFFFASSALLAVCGRTAAHLVEMLLRDVFEKRDTHIAAWLPFAFPALYFLWGLGRYINTTTVNFTSEKIVARIREDLLGRLLHSNLTFHNSFQGGTGGLISRIMNDTILLQVGLGFFGDIVREPLVALGLLSYMLTLDWKLTLAALVFAPIFVVLTRSINRGLRKYGHENRQSLEELTGTIKESLDGVRIIQSFNLEEHMQARFHKNMQGYLRSRGSIIRREEAVSPINEFLVSLLVMGFSLYAIQQIFLNQATGGEFVAFLTAAGLLQVPLKRLQETSVRIQQTLVVIDRLFELIEGESQVPEPIHPVPFPINWQTIEFRNVSFRYGGDWVLRNINLVIRRGEILALVGTSGSGKSTLVNLLSRFFDPTEGQIYFDRTPISDIALKDLRRHIALVTQDVFLFKDTIERNIQSGDFAADVKRTVPAAELANADAFIANLPDRYQYLVGERGNLLSGGEKQRISIARALFKNAPILILDEATSALDSVSEQEVQKGLQHLMEGRTAFLIAHRLSTVHRANRILVMRQGRVIEEGSHQSLIDRRGEYFAFFQLQTPQ